MGSCGNHEHYCFFNTKKS